MVTDIAPFLIIAITATLLIISECQVYEDEIARYIDSQVVKSKTKKAVKFYNSTKWHQAKRECKRLQMERTGLAFLMCEQCGRSSLDLDEYSKPIVMSVGHDKARSLYPELALEQDNLFIQCMPCNKAQGVDERMLTGYEDFAA